MNTEFETDYGYYGTPRWDDFSLDDENKAKKRFSRFFLALAVYLLIGNISAIIIQTAIVLIFGSDKGAEIINGDYFIWVVQVVCMYVLAFPAFYLITHAMRKTVRAKSKMNIKELLTAFLMAEGLMVAGNLIGNFLSAIYTTVFGYELSNATTELIVDSPIWLVTLVAVVIGPIIEELMFRKLLMDKLGMYGDRIAIIISAISFGIFHGNIFQVFYAAMLGALLAYIYSISGNIIYCIGLHITVNFFGSVIPMLLMEPSERMLELSEIVMAGGEIDMNEYMILTAILGIYALIQYGIAIAGIVILVKKYRRREFFVSDRCEVLIPKDRRSSVILKNFGAISFSIIIAITFILGLLPDTASLTEIGGNGNTGGAAFKIISEFLRGSL